MRRRLIAIPASSSPIGVRMDWSPKFRTLVVYAWYSKSKQIHTWSYHLRDLLHLGNRCQICNEHTWRYRYCGGDRGCLA